MVVLVRSFQKSLHAGVLIYVLAMFVALTIASLKLDFTGFALGRLGLLLLMVSTGIVAMRLLKNVWQSSSGTNQAIT